MFYRGTNKNNTEIKENDYVTSSFELAALYAVKQSNPIVLVLEGNVVEIDEEDLAYDGEFLAGQMTVKRVLVPSVSFASWEEVVMDDEHPLLSLKGWKTL